MLIIQLLDELQRKQVVLPFAEAALAPLGEIDGVDGTASKWVWRTLWTSGMGLSHAIRDLAS